MPSRMAWKAPAPTRRFACAPQPYERNPSAGVNVVTGFYKDFGDPKPMSFWDFALSRGNFGDIDDVIEHYSEKAGVSTEGRGDRGGGKAKSNGKGKAKARPRQTFASLQKAVEWTASGKGIAGPAVAVWPYSDSFAVARFPTEGGGKTYRPYCRLASGEWAAGDPPGPLPIFNLAEVEGDPSAEVVLVEGEKVACLLSRLGFTTTTSSHGAESAAKSDWSPLAGRRVLFLPDAGEAGGRYRDDVLGILKGLSPRPTVRVLELPGLDDKEDAEQWLERLPDGFDDEMAKAELFRLAFKAEPWDFEAKPATAVSDEPDTWIERGEVAHLGDVRRAIGEFKYAWKGWIQPGSITTFAADAGAGKTLICLKMCKTVWDNTVWPDGSENPIAKNRPSMWLCYDRAWHGIMRAAGKLGLPDESIILPTSKGKPLCVPDLDDPNTIVLLERLIRKFQPWALFIDTMTYATGANVAKAHEAKLAYSPLMGVMAETGCCCVSNTHLSNEGKVLNRRPTELSRIVLKLKAPDPEDQKRLRFWVDKSDDEKPPALGVTIGGDDRTPPATAGRADPSAPADLVHRLRAGAGDPR